MSDKDTQMSTGKQLARGLVRAAGVAADAALAPATAVASVLLAVAASTADAFGAEETGDLVDGISSISSASGLVKK